MAAKSLAKRLCKETLQDWDRATESTRLPGVDDDQVSEGSLCGRTQLVTESCATTRSNSKRGPARKAKNEARLAAFIANKGGSLSFTTAAERRAHNLAESTAEGCTSAGSTDGSALKQLGTVSMRERMESYWRLYAAAFALPNIKPKGADLKEQALALVEDGKCTVCNKKWDDWHADSDVHKQRAAIGLALNAVLGAVPGRTIYGGLKADGSCMRCATTSNAGKRRHCARPAH
jgi:hypothetical protein